MSINDKTRGRRTYSFFRSVPRPDIRVSTTVEVTNNMSGTFSSLRWDGDSATDETIGRYQTHAEVIAAIGSHVNPILIELKGTCVADVVGTYDWSNVEFIGNDSNATLTGEENVIIQNAQFNTHASITTTATSTEFLQYSAGRSAILYRGRFTGNSNVALIKANHEGTFNVWVDEGAIIDDYCFSVSGTPTYNLYLQKMAWSDNQGQIVGSTGTVNFYTSADAEGSYNSAEYTGTENFYVSTNPTKLNSVVISGTPSASGKVLTSTSTTTADWQTLSGSIAAALPNLDANDLVVFDLQNAANTTTITNEGSGDAMSLVFESGEGGTSIFHTPTRIGPALVFYGSGAAFTGSTGTSGCTYIPTTGNFTAECRFMLMEPPNADYPIASLFGKYANVPSGIGLTFAIAIQSTTGSATTDGIYTLKTAISTSAGFTSASIGKVSPWAEYHAAMTYDGSYLRSYLNGSLVSMIATSGSTIWDTTGPWVVGNIATSNLTSRLQTCRFANVARTESEIYTLYEAAAYNGAVGMLTASNIRNVTVSAGIPTSGSVLVATSATTAIWEVPAGGGGTLAGDVTGPVGSNTVTAIRNVNLDTVAPLAGQILRANTPISASWITQPLLFSHVDIVENSAGASTQSLSLTGGQCFVCFKNMYCDGVRIHWAAQSGTPDLTIDLWDGAGNNLATVTQAVSTTPTTYTILFGTPINLSSYKGQDLVVSVWENTGGVADVNYYSYITTTLNSSTTPLVVGEGVLSKGSIYDLGPATSPTAMPTTFTTAEYYPIDPILRIIPLCQNKNLRKKKRLMLVRLIILPT